MAEINKQEHAAEKTKPQGSGWLNVLVDYGPLIVFLGVYKYYAPAESEAIAEIAAVIKGTLAFMVAAVIALAFSKWKLGKVSPMLWFSTALIVGFGALTIFFGDPTFVQLKPTIIYGAFGVILLVACYWKGKAMLKVLLEAAFEGLSDAGWLKLSRNWGFFFLALAALNEVLRYFYNVDNGTFRNMALGQVLGIYAADIPVHIQPDTNAAQARIGCGAGR